MCVEEGRREVPRGHWSPCWAQIVNEFLWRSQICPRIFSCVLLDMCLIHMYCVGRCTHVRQLLEVRLSVTPISESISERDKGGRAHMSWQESPFPSELGALLSRLSRLHRPTCLFDMLTILTILTILLTIFDQVHRLNHLWVHWRWSGLAPWWSARPRCWPPPRCSAYTAPRSWEMKMMWMVLVVMTMLNVIAMRSVLGPLLGYESRCW